LTAALWWHVKKNTATDQVAIPATVTTLVTTSKQSQTQLSTHVDDGAI